MQAQSSNASATASWKRQAAVQLQEAAVIHNIQSASNYQAILIQDSIAAL